MELEWKTPKTDWTDTDRFNIVDYNRIKNNLFYIWKYSAELFGDFKIIDMGEDILDYSPYWKAEWFNNIENNLETINNNTLQRDIGIKQTFYPNGVFIKADELNRIEKAIAYQKMYLDGWMLARRKLSFTLGGVKGLYV